MSADRTFKTNWFEKKQHIFAHHLIDRFAGKPTRALEIGSFEGRSALWVLDNVLTHEESRIVCVDSHDYYATPTSAPRRPSHRPWWQHRSLADVKSRFLANTATHRAAAKLRYVPRPSALALRELPLERFDYIYIDGSHYGSDVLGDACAAWLFAAPGSVIAFDDYTWQHDGLAKPYGYLGRPKIAIDAFLAIFAMQYRLLENPQPLAGSQVWVERTEPNPFLEQP